MERLGQYAVTGKLADGGMGSVYRGRAPDGREVVLKVPHAQDRESALALADEARAGLRLRHPAIVETIDCFVDRGVSVLVVAYIDGVTLFEMRKRVAQLSAAAVAEVGAQVASALDAIHTAVDERGKPLSMLHRDVSPNNILVDGIGQARLIDLGIVRSSERQSKATMQGMVKGTLRYLAPEILAGGDHSAASDLWALGVTLYEAAIGHYAVAGDEMNTVRAIMDGTLFRQLREAPLDGALVDALGALICPVEQRMRNARAASAIFGRLATRLKDGRDELAHAMRMPIVRGPGSAVTSAPLEVTEVTARNAVGPETTAPTMLSSRGDVESVFTSNVAREALPTLQMPAAPSFLSPPAGATAASMPALSSTAAALPASSKAPVSSTAAAAPASSKAPISSTVAASSKAPISSTAAAVPASSSKAPVSSTAAALPASSKAPVSSTAAALPASSKAPSATEFLPAASKAPSATEFLPAASRLPSESAPTIQMPAVASTFETAPTIQMGAWTPPSAPPQPPPSPPPTPPPHSAMADKTAPVRDTRPIKPPQVTTTALSSSAATTAVPTSTSAPSSSAPPAAPKPQRQQAPAQSLFLPIVVIDDDGSELE